MNKKTIILALLSLLTVSAFAAPVTAEVARRVAVNFWNSHYPETQKPVADMQLQPVAEFNNMYFFVNGEEGFVVVAADDRVRPVLGYSFDSPFSEQPNPELRFWLSGYEMQIEAVKSVDKSADPRWETLLQTPPEAPLTLQHVPALLRTRWNQGEPYNAQCPYDENYHVRTVVGCVATAMAQIMKRWEHPWCGEGNHSYYSDYGLLTADFENTTYMWQNMPLFVNIGASESETEALSTLSYHCGVAVEMMYGPSATGGSGAYSMCYPEHNIYACAYSAFPTYFKYKPTLQHRMRMNHSEEAWLAYIDADLAAGRPIYYSGHDSTGGHAFVLDGSNLDTTYHFNWGWGGYGDGFYTMANLAPGSGGAGGNATYTFHQQQGAIFGIEPDIEQLDTIEVYDTICPNYTSYSFRGYNLPLASCDTHLHVLDTVFFLHLRRISLKVIEFKPNGGTGEEFSIQYCIPDGIVMPECPFTKDSLRFVGWCRNQNGSGAVYLAGDTVFLQGNMSLYAKWVDPALGIDAVEDENPTLWPNPTTGELHLALALSDNAQYYVIDAVGRTLMSGNIVHREGQISLFGLSAGVYTVQIRTSKGVYNQRIIKE